MAREQKQLLYIYDGDQAKLDDVEADIDGDLRVREKHEIIGRKGNKIIAVLGKIQETH